MANYHRRSYPVPKPLYAESKAYAASLGITLGRYGVSAIQQLNIASEYGFSRSKTKLIVDEAEIELPRLAKPPESTEKSYLNLRIPISDIEALEMHALSGRDPVDEAVSRELVDKRVARSLRFQNFVSEHVMGSVATFQHEDTTIVILRASI